MCEGVVQISNAWSTAGLDMHVSEILGFDRQ